MVYRLCLGRGTAVVALEYELDFRETFPPIILIRSATNRESSFTVPHSAMFFVLAVCSQGSYHLFDLSFWLGWEFSQPGPVFNQAKPCSQSRKTEYMFYIFIKLLLLVVPRPQPSALATPTIKLLLRSSTLGRSREKALRIFNNHLDAAITTSHNRPFSYIFMLVCWAVLFAGQFSLLLPTVVLRCAQVEDHCSLWKHQRHRKMHLLCICVRAIVLQYTLYIVDSWPGIYNFAPGTR